MVCQIHPHAGVAYLDCVIVQNAGEGVGLQGWACPVTKGNLYPGVHIYQFVSWLYIVFTLTDDPSGSGSHLPLLLGFLGPNSDNNCGCCTLLTVIRTDLGGVKNKVLLECLFMTINQVYLQ